MYFFPGDVFNLSKQIKPHTHARARTHTHTHTTANTPTPRKKINKNKNAYSNTPQKNNENSELDEFRIEVFWGILMT